MDPVEEQIDHKLPLTERRLAELKSDLDNNQIDNARHIESYAKKLLKNDSQHQQLIELLRLNASAQGQIYQVLVQRLQTVTDRSHLFPSQEVRYQELLDIYQAADPKFFSDALSDPLNVLADLSAGELDRINADSKPQTLAENQAQDFGYAALLIGHPGFGSWQQAGKNQYQWQWFEHSKMLAKSITPASISYRDWAKNRDYSFYADIGRALMTSVFIRAEQQQAELLLGEDGAFAEQRRGDNDLSAVSLVLKGTYHRE
ncbi:hypothetical protein [Thalassotalea sp. PS06]|uniref:hypothetical protein n=1 Tax=Thalassotalea sp. PS06 TaxID=2594005 RepID=UPI0011655D89|nr:hypothetical protein [Thalassotalea sp. PS06]QDP02265.1 hypothetical protein FNC98_13490 [Thalassotalea sp. PS06]